MPLYNYKCSEPSCLFTFEEFLNVDERDLPNTRCCPMCGNMSVVRIINPFKIKIRGASAANGYSSTVGDWEKATGKQFTPEEY